MLEVVLACIGVLIYLIGPFCLDSKQESYWLTLTVILAVAFPPAAAILF